ncbi:MAG: hypothetical protein D6776_10440 [Planctomycetota bacterium]|nr:MAG: hypothetical protein D6776_10440 [Planctomycetota bacterium]
MRDVWEDGAVTRIDATGVGGLGSDLSPTGGGAAPLESALIGRSRALAPVVRGERVLGPGSRGAGLRRVQQGLRALGLLPDGAHANGRWSESVREALVAFQQRQGLEPTGVIDAATVRALDHAMAPIEGALREAGADGSISTEELRAAERKLIETYGEERGRRILIAALGQNPDKISFEALDYIQGRIGSMEGHIARYEQVLRGHLAGAKLLDADFDGKLDADDLVFTREADGSVRRERLGRALRDRVEIGRAMVDAAYALAEKEPEFGDLEFNPGAWRLEDEDLEYEDGMGVMVPADGVPPSVAIEDIFKNTDMYAFECATALTIIRYKAILDLIGPEDFDRAFADLRVGPWETEDDAKRLWKIEGSGARGEERPATEAEKKLVKPGEYTYFRNWDVSKEAFEGGWQGENVLYLGDGLYYGHPFGVVSGEDIVEYLNSARKAGATRSASLLDLRARIDPSVFELDEIPNE